MGLLECNLGLGMAVVYLFVIARRTGTDCVHTGTFLPSKSQGQLGRLEQYYTWMNPGTVPRRAASFPVPGILGYSTPALVAQSAERAAVNRKVVGSIPTRGEELVMQCFFFLKLPEFQQ